jgi:ArsR family transcriptional regulator, lead/cadmium/zinc/bismuth-responsive transcriptional repressor
MVVQVSTFVDEPACGPREHASPAQPRVSDQALGRAVALFRALGDPARLRTLELLAAGELCVGEVAEALGEELSTVSHRLRLLRTEGLVERRREGRHIRYQLADHHVLDLVRNALEHVAHGPSGSTTE